MGFYHVFTHKDTMFKVKNKILQYYQWFHDKWNENSLYLKECNEAKEREIYQNFNIADFGAMNSDINEDLFDNFTRHSMDSLSQKLLKDVILDNKSLVYSIVARDAEQVKCKVSQTVPHAKTENYFETQFYSFTVDFSTDITDRNKCLLTRPEKLKIFGSQEKVEEKKLLVKDSEK